VRCVFTNTQNGRIEIEKQTLPNGSAATFDFTGDVSGTLSDGGSTGANVAPGNYSSVESAKAGWALTSIVCDDGNSTGDTATRTASFIVAPGETVRCVFTNTQNGRIEIEKQTLPNGSAATFDFTGDVSGTLSDGGSTGANVAPGNYSSVESAKAGWDLTSIVCDDSNSTGVIGTGVATFIVAPGETVRCVFTNRQRGLAKVIKTVNGAPPSGTQSFTFQLRTGASDTQAGQIVESATADVNNGGIINFATQLIPGTTYQLCEIVMPGWMTTLGPPLYVVFNPSGDNSTVCTDFSVQPGETKTFTIDNKPPPGGLARTIGFWKNWASCAPSNGRQKPILDQTLALALSTNSPLYWGAKSDGTLLYLKNLTCSDAVSLLNKSNIKTGKKMSSDPAFNLAAQLIAAELNVVAGAGTCPNAITAINAASALLAAVHFDGTKHDSLSASQAAQMNSLATTLDKYNNNTLC
jgi:Prealbumin-like fold domain